MRPLLLAAAVLAFAPAVRAAAAQDQAAPLDERKNTALLTTYGDNAKLPPDQWSCPVAAGGRALNYAKTPRQYAADLQCLTEWLWSVKRYYAAGGKPKKGVEPEFVARERERAVAAARWLERWASQVEPEAKTDGR